VTEWGAIVFGAPHPASMIKMIPMKYFALIRVTSKSWMESLYSHEAEGLSRYGIEFCFVVRRKLRQLMNSLDASA
jgi:hypothetical protein